MSGNGYEKTVEQDALAFLLQKTRGIHTSRWEMVLDSLMQYVLDGYMEAPGANMVPFKTDDDIPRDAVDIFTEFLVMNGEERWEVEAEMDRGMDDMETTVGMTLVFD